MLQHQPSWTGHGCYGCGCKPRRAPYAINVVLSWQCCYVLRACRSRDSNYIAQETKRVVPQCFTSMFQFNEVRLSNTQRSAAIHFLPQVPSGLRTTIIATFMVALATQHPWLPEVRTVDRKVYIYVGRQNNISCSTSINLFTVLKGFHERRVLRYSPPKEERT